MLARDLLAGLEHDAGGASSRMRMCSTGALARRSTLNARQAAASAAVTLPMPPVGR